MKKSDIWDFWAKKYDKLWVQKYSLRPTRNYILSTLSAGINKDKNIKILDLGCGPGELINEISNNFYNCNVTGIDFSEKMLEISRQRNSEAKHIKMDAEDLCKLDDKFDIITCTHSLPYYKTPEKVMKELSRLLDDDGRIYIGFASGDNMYDKLALSIVKFTTGPANYPSDEEFRKIVASYFEVEKLKIIREKQFMPRIAVYTLKKVAI